MRRLITLLIGVHAVLGSAAVCGQVSVEILSAPREVASFGPLYVLYSIENIGTAPVYLPADEEEPGRGHALHMSRFGEAPARLIGLPIAERLLPHAERTMWLAPGERWLFYRDIGRHVHVLEGELSIQAVLSSKGLCHAGQEYGRQSFPLEPLYVETVSRGVRVEPVYRCWKGEALSSVWNVTVKQPSTPRDLEVFEYLRERGAVEHRGEGMWWLQPQFAIRFEERFPTSHYSYAHLVHQSSILPKIRAVELQPDHPMTPWVNGAIARKVLDTRSSCWRHATKPVDFPIDELELPDGVREYLDQYQWYLENRRCPNQLEEERQRQEADARRARQREGN
jgi:hypothetical protein